MNILFTRFPLESALGGAEIQTLSLMEGLAERGHSVSFLGSCPVLLEECLKRGISVTKLDIGTPPVTKIRALTFPFWSREAQKKLQTAMEQLGFFDVICMLSLTEKLLITDWLSEQHAAVFWLEHDRIGRWLTQNPELAHLRDLSRRVMTVTVSELSRHIFMDLGWQAERTVAIPNGIDPKRFQLAGGLTHQLTPRKDKIHIGCIARLSPEKGVNLLIEAVMPLVHTELTILGKGKDEARLRHQIERSGLTERVHILPAVPDLGAFYASRDVLVLPSIDNDPFGLVAAEAMMLGIPVVVTAQTGIASYLTHQEDALIAEPISASLQTCIAQLEDKTFRTKIATHGQRTAEKLFSITRMLDDYEKLLQSRVEH